MVGHHEALLVGLVDVTVTKAQNLTATWRRDPEPRQEPQGRTFTKKESLFSFLATESLFSFFHTFLIIQN